MAIVSRATLKTFFETRDVPTQQEFSNLLDSVVIKDEDTGQPNGVAPLGANGLVPEEYLPPITANPFASAFTAFSALTGGGVGALDAVDTALGNVDTGDVAFVVAGEFSVWQLQASVAAEDAAGGLVRPDDFDAITNARVWVRIA